MRAVLFGQKDSIFLFTCLSKDFILIDDLCDVKNKKLTRSYAHKNITKLQKKNLDGEIMQAYIKTSPGRILLNQSFEYNY